MRKIVVTGATSFIGIHLIEKLIEKGDYIYAIVRPKSSNLCRLKTHERIKVIELELDDYDKLYQSIHDQIDILYHLAWEGTRAPFRDDHNLQYKNYEASLRIMETAIKLGVKVFVGSGSQAEYGSISGRITEDILPKPKTEYGKAKLEAYKKLYELAASNNINFKWTRIFSVYGKYDYQNSLVMSSLKKLSNNETLQLTPCTQNWDFINVEDVVSVMLLLGTKDCEDGVYNIASGTSKPLKEFVLDMKRLTNSKSKLEFGAVSYGPEGVISFEPVIDKLKNNLNWSCNISFDEGICRLFHYLKQEGNI